MSCSVVVLPSTSCSVPTQTRCLALPLVWNPGQRGRDGIGLASSGIGAITFPLFTAPVAKVLTNIALRPHRCDGLTRESTISTKSRNPRGTEESKLAAPTALIERNPPRVPLVDRATPIKDSMWLERKP